MTNLYLTHHGIKGQKWGVRRFQNADGSLTPEGYKHYGYNKDGSIRVGASDNEKARSKQGGKIGTALGVGVGLASFGMDVSTQAAMAAASWNAIINPAALVGIGAFYVGKYALSGYVHGRAYGAIAGYIETKKGREYIEEHKDDFKRTMKSLDDTQEETSRKR